MDSKKTASSAHKNNLSYRELREAFFRIPMDLEIILPDEVPAMTLPNVTFFPQALLPLHIFEARYQQMLVDVLASNRLFAVAGLNERHAKAAELFEPPHRIASVGIVRACQKNADGTSNLLIQGLCRVELLEIVTDHPYRRVRVQALPSAHGAGDAEAARLRAEVDRLLNLKQKLGSLLPPGIADFLRKVEDPETFADLAAFNLGQSQAFKQQLLETLDLHTRLKLLGNQLQRDIGAIQLQRKLQARLPDERIDEN